MSVLTNVSSSFASKNSNVSIKESFEQGAKWAFQKCRENILGRLSNLPSPSESEWIDTEDFADELNLLLDLIESKLKDE